MFSNFMEDYLELFVELDGGVVGVCGGLWLDMLLLLLLLFPTHFDVGLLWKDCSVVGRPVTCHHENWMDRFR